LTPILAKVNEEQENGEEEVNRTPYFAGSRRSLMQRQKEIAEADMMAAVEAQKHTVDRGYMREEKEIAITSQAGTPVTFALTTPSFTLPTGNATPAKALMGASSGTPSKTSNAQASAPGKLKPANIGIAAARSAPRPPGRG
jgi:hypothetical protein